MKKYSRIFLVILFTVFVISACTNTKKESHNVTTKSESKLPFEGRTMNVVTTSDKYVPLFSEFTKETGAKVEFLSMSSGEVISRTKAEKKPMADLWFGGGLDAFMEAKKENLLEKYQPKNIDQMPQEYRDQEGYWISKGLTVVGFLANNEILKEKNIPIPKSWKDLADAKYKGEVIMSNPEISGTNYAAVKGLLDMQGENGWNYLKSLNDNIQFYGKRGKDPEEKVSHGEFGVGIIPVDESSFKTAKDNKLTVIYPEDGIPWVPEGVAIFKNSKNVDIAKAFEDFLLTEKAQKIIAQVDGKDSAQLVVPNIQGLDLGLPKDKLIKQDLKTFGSQREDILRRFKELAKGKL